jgi:hypothetical protein
MRVHVVLKPVSLAIGCSLLLASSGLSGADEYRPDEYLSLDLSRALLSPKRLGPPAEFAPVALEAMSDRGTEGTQANVEPKPGPKITPRKPQIAHRHGGAHASVAPKVPAKIVSRSTRVAHAPAKPRIAVPSRLARRAGNPLDAQAFDTRVQVWPCRSGGICNWKR